MASDEETQQDLQDRVERLEKIIDTSLQAAELTGKSRRENLLRIIKRRARRPSITHQEETSKFAVLAEQLSREKARVEELEKALEHLRFQQTNFAEELQTERAFRKEFHYLLDLTRNLEQEHRRLRIDFHEWLALQSMGIDLTSARLNRIIPLRAYLSETPEKSIENVSNAVEKLIHSFEFELTDEFPEIRGSWYKKWFARSKEAVTQPAVTDRLARVERALELQSLNLPQAAADEKQAAAIANLIQSLKDVPNAAIQVGSILLVKQTNEKGPTIQTRTLTPRQIIEIENNPQLLYSPSDILEKLFTLSQRSDPVGSSGTNLLPHAKGASFEDKSVPSPPVGQAPRLTGP